MLYKSLLVSNGGLVKRIVVNGNNSKIERNGEQHNLFGCRKSDS